MDPDPNLYANTRKKYQWLLTACHFLPKRDREEMAGDFIEVIIKLEKKEVSRWNKYWFITVKIFQLILAGFKMEYEHMFPKRKKERK